MVTSSRQSSRSQSVGLVSLWILFIDAFWLCIVPLLEVVSMLHLAVHTACHSSNSSPPPPVQIQTITTGPAERQWFGSLSDCLFPCNFVFCIKGSIYVWQTTTSSSVSWPSSHSPHKLSKGCPARDTCDKLGTGKFSLPSSQRVAAL